MALSGSTSLTLEQIQRLSGHGTTDGVRMALRRAGVTASGIAVGTECWPPKKLYDIDEVWKALADHIIRHAETDPAVKDLAWKYFRDHIIAATRAPEIGDVFADKLNH